MKIKIENRKKFCGQKWRAGLTGHGQSSQLASFRKFAKMALFNPCMIFEKKLDQMTSFKVVKNIPQDFIQKVPLRFQISLRYTIWVQFARNSLPPQKNVLLNLRYLMGLICTELPIMAIPVVGFSREGYKTRKVFF